VSETPLRLTSIRVAEYFAAVFGLYTRMALMGRLHPLLAHFPIALILIAAVAELLAMTTRVPEWRAVAVVNLRAGAAFAIASAVAGWLLASSRIVEASPSLEWHRWLGTSAAVLAIGAAFTSGPLVYNRSSRLTWGYRVAVFCAAGLVGVAGHFGAVLVWGANFLRPWWKPMKAPRVVHEIQIEGRVCWRSRLCFRPGICRPAARHLDPVQFLFQLMKRVVADLVVGTHGQSDLARSPKSPEVNVVVTGSPGFALFRIGVQGSQMGREFLPHRVCNR